MRVLDIRVGQPSVAHPVFALKRALRAIYLVKAVHLSTHWRRYLGYVSIDSVLRIAGKRDPESGWTFIEEALAGWEPPAWTAEYQYASLVAQILWAGYSSTDVMWGGCDGRTDETDSAFQPCLEDVANNLLAVGFTDRRMLYWAGVVVREAHTVQDPNRQSHGDAAPHTWQSCYLPAEAVERSLPRHTVEPQQWEYVVLPVAHIMTAIPHARATQSLKMMARRDIMDRYPLGDTREKELGFWMTNKAMVTAWGERMNELRVEAHMVQDTGAVPPPSRTVVQPEPSITPPAVGSPSPEAGPVVEPALGGDDDQDEMLPEDGEPLRDEDPPPDEDPLPDDDPIPDEAPMPEDEPPEEEVSPPDDDLPPVETETTANPDAVPEPKPESRT